MAVLKIHDLPDEMQVRLRARAAKAGRTVRAEVRAILISVLSHEPTAVSVQTEQTNTRSDFVKRYDEFMDRTKAFTHGPITREEMNSRQ